VLVLSRFAGAAKQLKAALLINPYDVTESANALRGALRMPVAEQAARMRRMRTNIATFSAARWAQLLIRDSALHIATDVSTRSSADVRSSVNEDIPVGQTFEDSHLST
jgi:trehalose-6-phosphate synthase